MRETRRAEKKRKGKRQKGIRGRDGMRGTHPRRKDKIMQIAISENVAEVTRLNKWGGRLLANLQARPQSRPEVEPRRWKG